MLTGSGKNAAKDISDISEKGLPQAFCGSPFCPPFHRSAVSRIRFAVIDPYGIFSASGQGIPGGGVVLCGADHD